jgi:uncharacterized protein
VGAPPDKAWRAYDSWSPEQAAATRQVLSISSDSEHTLAAAPGSVASTTFTVQPTDTCPEAGPLTQPCSQARRGLRFTGPVLATDTEVTGHPLVELWMASPQPDQNVFIYLEDLDAEGRASVVTEGRLKASLRATLRPPYDTLGLPWQRSLEADHQPLSGAEAVPLQFDMLPLSHVFKAGHRLRVVVSASDPRERVAGATGHGFTLFSGARQSSSITLPLMPARQP